MWREGGGDYEGVICFVVGVVFCEVFIGDFDF